MRSLSVRTTRFSRFAHLPLVSLSTRFRRSSRRNAQQPVAQSHLKSDMDRMRLRDARLARNEKKDQPISGLKGSVKAREFRFAIRQLKTGSEVIDFLQKHVSTQFDASVYSVAMKHCWECDEFGAAHKVFRMSIESGEFDAATYSIFFNICAESDKFYDIAFGIFEKLRAEGKMEVMSGPCFGALVKCCQTTGDVTRALEFMADARKDPVVPKNLLLASFLKVCAKAGDLDTAIQEFNFFRHTYASELSIQVICAMVAVCNEVDDLLSTLKIDEMRREYGIEATHNYWIILATCYMRRRQFAKSMECLTEAEKLGTHRKVFAVRMLVTMTHLFQLKSKEEMQQKWTEMLKICEQMVAEKLTLTLDTHMLLLRAQFAINEPHWQNSVPFFEGMMDDEKVGIWSNDGRVDLHYFGIEECRFVLRYVFAMCDRKLLKGKAIVLICGRGKHSDANAKKEGRSLRNVIIDELSSWTPPICTRAHRNPGCLVCERNDVAAFFKQVPHGAADFCFKSLLPEAFVDAGDSESEEEMWKDL